MLITLSDGILDPSAYPLSFEVNEKWGDCGSYILQYQSQLPNVEFEQMIGKAINVGIEREEGVGKRYFNALVVSARDDGHRADQYMYRLELASWLYQLRFRKNSRIFQNKTAPEIIEEVFAEYTVANYSNALSRNYAEREYCVQFQETDYEFVTRLMDEEGILYRWVHEEGSHSLELGDDPLGASESEGSILFIPDSHDGRAIEGLSGVQRLNRKISVATSKYALRDYDYHVPGKELLVSAQAQKSHSAEMELEYYDYSANYREADRGEHLARVRVEALQAAANLHRGEGNVRHFEAGAQFALANHPSASRNGQYVLVSVNYRFIQDEPDASSTTGDLVQVSFTCLPADTPYRCVPRYEKPQIPGTQTATVVGVAGEDIHTDKLARIRVHFHWDRYSTNEHDSSCWIRVVQMWNGKSWGFLAMPRVGNEVLISYVDNDIDRPVATGQVYNGELPPPYDLPKDIRYSGFVSRSLQHGEPSNASMLTFDDTRGEERILFHTERDMQKTVERNESTFIANDSYEVVDNTRTAEIKNEIEAIENKDSKVTNNVSKKAVSNSVTGVSTSFTGVSTALTGVSTSMTGVSTSTTGVSNSATGVSTSATGVSTSMTGISNSVTGVSNSVTGLSNSLKGVANSMTGLSNSMTGVSTSTTGVSNSVTGLSNSMTGVSTSTTGVINSVTGISTRMTGISTSATGARATATGVSVSATGVSTSATGVSVSTTGVSISFTGVSFSKVGLNVKA